LELDRIMSGLKTEYKYIWVIISNRVRKKRITIQDIIGSGVQGSGELEDQSSRVPVHNNPNLNHQFNLVWFGLCTLNLSLVQVWVGFILVH